MIYIYIYILLGDDLMDPLGHFRSYFQGVTSLGRRVKKTCSNSKHGSYPGGDWHPGWVVKPIYDLNYPPLKIQFISTLPQRQGSHFD